MLLKWIFLERNLPMVAGSFERSSGDCGNGVGHSRSWNHTISDMVFWVSQRVRERKLWALPRRVRAGLRCGHTSTTHQGPIPEKGSIERAGNNNRVVGRILAPKDVHVLITGSYEYISLHSKGELRSQMGLSIQLWLKWRDFSELSRKAQRNQSQESL